MTGAELAQVAAIKGAPVHAIVRELYSERTGLLKRRQRDAVWATIPLDCRMALVSGHTLRPNIENAACMAWSQFTEDEQIAIGAAYRRWCGQAAQAGCLR